MARNIDDILNEMLTAKAATPELDGLTSDSRVAVWRLLLYVVAVAVWSMEKLWDIFRAEVDDYVARSVPHTLRWYRDRVLEFREGKELNWLDGAFRYPPLEDGEDLEDLQIVTQAAVVEAPGTLLVKVATGSGGSLQPLTLPQAERVLAYVNQIKDAGNFITLVNEPPDELKLTGTIYVDPLLINLSDGSLVSNPSRKPAEEAVLAYINAENEENFNGELRRTRLVDILQQAEGVKDPVLTSVQARYASLPFEEVAVRHLPRSGYYTVTEITFTYEAV